MSPAALTHILRRSHFIFLLWFPWASSRWADRKHSDPRQHGFTPNSINSNCRALRLHSRHYRTQLDCFIHFSYSLKAADHLVSTFQICKAKHLFEKWPERKLKRNTVCERLKPHGRKRSAQWVLFHLNSDGPMPLGYDGAFQGASGDRIEGK